MFNSVHSSSKCLPHDEGGLVTLGRGGGGGGGVSSRSKAGDHFHSRAVLNEATRSKSSFGSTCARDA